ncbi:dockerin type I domain-containing protein [Ruminococcus sp.]|uniref:dockerin type I domain-containing protein n=1 Tax=Ruminococcus sp. TaxID=41978 RepID=UPI0025EE0F47|nr:dockerin type I domain-containing protein [Ruminococcus sp.]
MKKRVLAAAIAAMCFVGTVPVSVVPIAGVAENVQEQTVLTENNDVIYGIGVSKEPDKTTYKIGEQLDLTGLRLNGSYRMGELISTIIDEDYQELLNSNVPIKIDASKFDNTKAGRYHIYVVYGNTKTSFTVTVYDDAITTTIAVTETKPVTTITMPVVDDPTMQTSVVTVTIMDISGDIVLVKPVDGSPELKSSSKFSLSANQLPVDINPKVGMKLEITYNGGILETYPAMFGNVQKVVEVKEDTVKEDPTLLKGTKDMTLNDVMRLAELGDELDWADFKNYKGRDVGSGLYIWEYKLEDGYVLDVGGSTDKKPIYIILSCNNEKGIDIRTDDVKEYIAATAVPVVTEKDTITEFGTGGLWSDPENSDFILKNMTLNDVIELSIKSDTVVLKWSDFTDYKGEDISSESSLWEKEWTFKIDDEYTLKVCGKTDIIFPDHVYLSDNSKRRIDICTDDVKAFLNKGIGEDSLSISEDIKEHFRVYETYSDENTKPERRLVQDFKSIMRYYNVPVRFVFKEYDNIDDILASAYATKKYYVVKQHDGTLQCYNEHLKEMKSNRQTIKNGETLTLPYLDIPEKAFERFNDPDFVKNYISPDVNVENVYYLSGESSHMGTAIYYRTDKGDYVYYNHYSIGEKLFPIEDFCKYQKAISDELAKHSDENGSGDIDISDLMDLSKYELKNTTSTSESLKGDANCDGQVDLSDAVMIMQALANPNKYGLDGTAEHHLTEQGKLNGDMNGDGLTSGDALAIQRKLLGLDKTDDQSLDSSLIANKLFIYEKETALGVYDISFGDNGKYYCHQGHFDAARDWGTWNISGDTVVLTGQFGTNRFSFKDNALIYIEEGSDGFNDVKPKDGEKFNLAPEMTYDVQTKSMNGVAVSIKSDLRPHMSDLSGIGILLEVNSNDYPVTLKATDGSFVKWDIEKGSGPVKTVGKEYDIGKNGYIFWNPDKLYYQDGFESEIQVIGVSGDVFIDVGKIYVSQVKGGIFEASFEKPEPSVSTDNSVIA